MVEQGVFSGAGIESGAVAQQQGATDALQTQRAQIEREGREERRLQQLNEKQISGGGLTQTERDERSALALFPGSPEAQELFRNRKNNTEEEQHKLDGWFRYKRPEQARERELFGKIADGKASDAEKSEAKLWDRFGHNPEAVDLAKRKEAGQPLSKQEESQLAQYVKATEPQSAPGPAVENIGPNGDKPLVMDNPYNKDGAGPRVKQPAGLNPDQGGQKPEQSGPRPSDTANAYGRQGDSSQPPAPPPQQSFGGGGAPSQNAQAQGDPVAALAALYPNDSQLVSEFSRYLQGQQLQTQEMADMFSKIKFPGDPTDQLAYYNAYMKQQQGQPLSSSEQQLLQH